MGSYSIIAQSDKSTVISEYTPETKRSDFYQSEAELEKKFISMLQQQSYEYIQIHTEEDLIQNLRLKLEDLNHLKFSDCEWDRLFKGELANPNEGIEEKNKKIQEDGRVVLKMDNGSDKNITLIDKLSIHENKLQVINQYENNDGKYKNRYDVTILVNGFPLVHIELKRRGIALKEAFNQINRYKRDSFWASSGLYEYVQIFVISNGTNTKYYSNTTRAYHVKDMNTLGGRKKSTSNTFEFTSFWADANNTTIPDLIDFTKTFFSKHTLLNIITKYCVFTTEKLLLVMRPYQIVASERILNKIQISNNYKTYGTIKAGGYIWHTTGSGKTLTSFKTAQLACKLPYIDKVLFVVDRKDLDYQTMREYDKFEKGAANSNRSTKILKKQLEDNDARIIITTIQKLNNFISKYKDHEIYQKHCVIIFDECHRSQFGEMHTAITKKFKKYYLFGFTGTPIFAENSSAITSGKFLKTTEQAFGDKLHTYTVVDAIRDKNVLPFRVDYIKTFDKKDNINDKLVFDINREEVYLNPKRVSMIVKYILDNFNSKTYRNKKYQFNSLENINEVSFARKKIEEKKRTISVSGFNSIFCVSSINAAKAYYNEFKKQINNDPSKRINIATIFSYGVNEDESDGILDEENSEDTENLDSSSRDFLENAIKDYNKLFSTNFDTSSDKFQNYYKDVSLRMKNKEIDLLIVVNMFLTGFDATTLNTLWVDKNLKQHGLIQAFSRTNRILNSIKTFGNIVCFRDLEKNTNEAISLFGDDNATGICLLRGYKDYYEGYTDEKGKYHDGYCDLIDNLKIHFPLIDPQIIGEHAQKTFINLFSSILRMRNLLSSFDEFKDDQYLTDREMQDYTSRYNDLYIEYKKQREENKEDISDDIIFEIELVRHVEINIDYILYLIKKYHDGHCKDKEIILSINRAIQSTIELRSKQALIDDFISNHVKYVDDVMDEWAKYVTNQKEKQLKSIISEENLKEAETRRFIKNSFDIGTLKTTGADIDKLMPPISRFGNSKRDEKKHLIIQKIEDFFNRFFGIS